MLWNELTESTKLNISIHRESREGMQQSIEHALHSWSFPCRIAGENWVLKDEVGSFVQQTDSEILILIYLHIYKNVLTFC